MSVSSNENNSTLQNTKQPLRAALYARVSTGRQENEETIDSQIDEIKARISLDGNVLSLENIFQDDGWTGEMLIRPGLDAMRDAATSGLFDILYVYDRGRLSRVFAYQEIILEEIIDRGIEFVTLHDVKAETPEERVLQAMQGVFHEYERVKIAERMRRGKLYKARNGVLINGHSLYGYNYIKKTETVPAHYEINEEQSKVVKMIFNWVGNEGVSLREVIKRLFDMGILPRKQKSEFWTKGPVVRLLQQKAYIDGIVYFNKSEAVVAKKPIKNNKYKKVKRSSRRMRPEEDWIPFKVPTILEDQVLFDKVQKILFLNQKFACKKRKYEYLLSGLAFCECGNRRVGDGIDKDNFYYRCAERIYKFPKEKKCNSKGVNAVALDVAFWKELVKFLAHPKWIRKYAEIWLKQQSNNDKDKFERDNLLKVINNLEEEGRRYSKAYGQGAMEFEQFKDLMRETTKKKKAFYEQLNALNTKIAQEGIDENQLELIIEEAKRIIRAQNLDNKFQVVRDIITQVILKGVDKVIVKGRLPLFALNMGYEPKSRNCWSS
jgi:site-specific DNA recombinase